MRNDIMKNGRWLLGLALLTGALGLAGCESTSPHGVTYGGVRSSPERVYNPQTRNFEWVTPGRPSTSPGADHTSGLAFY